MTVLYSDDVCAVCVKPVGALSEDKGDGSVPALLAQLGLDAAGIAECAKELCR